ncbi:hypothetical protein D7B24_001637 [Verticillium nonalfalfae]|uniref:Uncharacterized protein n=1 Tax=Verticillium nonalfalfae TaxID=1051616 RepID=A0A3M9Y000_9PEZI|nr:uncharacterized protein D7B24_001637 [Verticillium nonalfalfae]RNJ53584.1 hypothetical protein D7B24_001637 [Verticillium nonalfalfae]
MVVAKPRLDWRSIFIFNVKMTASQDIPKSTQDSASAGTSTLQSTSSTKQQQPSTLSHTSECLSQSAFLFSPVLWNGGTHTENGIATVESSPTTGEPFVARADLDPIVAGIGGWADPDLGRLSDLNIDIESEVYKYEIIRGLLGWECDADELEQR